MAFGMKIGMWGIALALMATDAVAAKADFAWPDGKKAAVSLAYDDALDSQLDNAIPALDRHGLKGSFYLQLSRETVLRRMVEWRAAARNGHELGNHSLFHQCSGSQPDRDWVEPQRDLVSDPELAVIAQSCRAEGVQHGQDAEDHRGQCHRGQAHRDSSSSAALRAAMSSALASSTKATSADSRVPRPRSESVSRINSAVIAPWEAAAR